MLFSPAAYVGISLGSGRASFTLAALDTDFSLLALSRGRLKDALAFVENYASVIVALDAPSYLARPAARKRTNDGLRAADRELRDRGIQISRVALKPESPRGKHGRALYEGLRKTGFVRYPDDGASRLWLEANPHACFTVLLGKNPMPRQTLEGRLQRQIILYDLGVGVSEPMNFFDELTRHNLKLGQLPFDQVYTSDQLDALVLAYTAWMAIKRPAETNSVGMEDNGIVLLPVGELQKGY